MSHVSLSPGDATLFARAAAGGFPQRTEPGAGREATGLGRRGWGDGVGVTGLGGRPRLFPQRPFPGPQSRVRGLRALPAPMPPTGTRMLGPQTHLHLPGPQAGHRRRLAGPAHHEELLPQGGAADAVEGHHLHRELPFPAGRRGTDRRGRLAHSVRDRVRDRDGRGSSRSRALPPGRPAARWSGQAAPRRLVAPAVWDTSTHVGRWPGRSSTAGASLGPLEGAS